MSVVIYGVGSFIVVDVEETCRRLGLEIVAMVKNIEGRSFASASFPVITADQVSAKVTSNEFLVPLFTPAYRRTAADDARARGFTQAATVVDPTSAVAASTVLGPGTYVNSGVTIGGAGHIGRFVFVNRSASLGHHAEIADFVSIGPGVVIAGNVRLGRGAVVGVGAIILPELEIGANSVVGAGSVVTKAVPPHCLVIGNPARVIKTDIPGYKDLSI